KIEGRRIRMPAQLRAALTAMETGETARLGVLRDGRGTNFHIVAGATSSLPAPRPAATATPQRVPKEFNWKGMEIEVFTQVVPVDTLGGKAVPGAEIGEIVGGSDAARAGLQANDVILEVNSIPVGTPAQMNRALQNIKGQTANLLRLMRGGREFFVVLP
ncbi:MAG: PDZ domain-containing protein, partial [Acidobacteriota bacterium]